MIDVRANRWPNGLCVGSVATYFVGSVVPRHNQKIVAVNPMGFPDSWAIWDERNLNNIVLDQIKEFVATWVENGRR